MKVLVISCGTGGGHNTAAHAVCENLRMHGDQATFLELYDLQSRRKTDRVSRTYVWSVRHAQVFAHVYRIGESYDRRHSAKSPVYRFNSAVRGRLARIIDEGAFDAVVTTHLFAGEALTALRREGRLDIPLVAVETDYTCIPFWDETELDCYVIPHEECLPDFIAHGLPADRIAPIGIPVAPVFSVPTLSHDEAREQVLNACGMDPLSAAPVFFVLSGSMGFGNVEGLVRCLLDQGDARIIVGCGCSSALHNRLREVFIDTPAQGGSDAQPADGRVAVKGYLPDSGRYMRACDVLLTKPGGLTSTEAAVLGVPMVHTDPIPGCEERNLEFFVDHGLSVTDRTVEGQAMLAYWLAGDEEACARMVEAQHMTISADAAERLRETLCGMVLSTKGRRTA